MEQLIELSRYLGCDFSLIQGGGGNTSVKQGDLLWVKASGYELSEIDSSGFVTVKRQAILDLMEDKSILRKSGFDCDNIVSERMNNTVLNNYNALRPSIETFLHAILPHTYVVHLHSIVINGITCRMDGEGVAETIFKNRTWGWVKYARPGYPLALAIKKVVPIDINPAMPYVLFLENHGVVLAANSTNEIRRLLDELLKRTLSFIGTWKWNESSVFKLTDLPHFASQMQGALYPDHVVYCGGVGIFCNGSDLDTEREKYFERYKVFPMYGVVDGEIRFFNSKEDVFLTRLIKAHAETVGLSMRMGGKPKFLPHEEVAYLLNWESEKYRQKLRCKKENVDNEDCNTNDRSGL